MQKPTYRLATSHDLPQLVELRVLMQKEVNNFQSDTEVSSGYTTSVQHYFERSLRDGSYFSTVAELNGILVSANGVVIYNKPPSITGGSGRVGYVTNVYTLLEWRGYGIASDLMKFMTKHARLMGLSKLHLGATELGKGVYERVGFKRPSSTSFELKF